MTTVAPRVLAFYLPQFHPVPENDVWWGEGFTEWTNVRRARPLFDGHLQPEEPGELGYYDLRSADTRRAQADLARAHGVSGFCYYHYWFNGRRLLGGVLDEVLTLGEPDLPFCLCWANESWTRSWDGLERDVLLRQSYSADDDLRHIGWLARVFEDPRYIRVHGRPLFLVYRASRLPSALQTASRWRQEMTRFGLHPPYLCTVENFSADRLDPTRIGFDAAVEFQPDSNQSDPLVPTIVGQARVFEYASMVERALRRPPAPYLRYPCVTTGWDNTPRRRRDVTVFVGATPELYGRWLEDTIARVVTPSAEENFVFVNAWNEWGEGAHLEPSARSGRAYLETTRDVVQRAGIQVAPVPVRVSHSRPPRVTIAMPTYNGAAHLDAAIASVLSQSFDDFELLVLDDGSADETVALAARINDRRIRIEQRRVRGGLVRNWNHCLHAATGEYVTLFHQDDVMEPANVACKVALLDEHPTAVFVHSNVRQVGPDGAMLSEYWDTPPAQGEAVIQRGRDYLNRLFFGSNVVCCPSVMLRRETVLRYGGFDQLLPFTADWELWMRLCVFHDAAYCPDTLVSYRRHPAAETERFRGALGLEQEFMAKHLLLLKHGAQLPVEEWRAHVTDRYEQEAVRRAGESLDAGRPDETLEFLRLAVDVRGYGTRGDMNDREWISDVLTRLSNHSSRRWMSDEINAWTRRCEALEAEIAALKRSASWRLMAPARVLFRALTGRPN